MKRIILSLSFLLFLSTLQAQKSASFGAAKFAPADGQKLLIIGQDLDAVGGLNNYTDGYVDNFTSHLPAGVTSYTSLESLGGLTALANWGSGDVRAQSYLEDATFDNSFIVIGLYLVGQLQNISNGNLDANIKTFAAWVKNQNRPVFIRIGYEFEGPWNSYNPTQFRAAWQHIVHVFDDENVQNAAYVWQSAGLNYSNIINWYPGDEYVNWFGFSQFDGGNAMGQSIMTFATNHNKPVMIAEATPRIDIKTGNGQTHWNNWYQPLFDRIYANTPIKALAYINVNWDSQPMWTGQGWGDSRVQANAIIKSNWENEIAKTPWLTGGNDLFETIDYQNWITSTTPTTLPKERLLIHTHQNQIHVSRNNNKQMKGLQIWGYAGQLLYSDLSPKQQYDINLRARGGIVIAVNIENQQLTEKMVLMTN